MALDRRDDPPAVIESVDRALRVLLLLDALPTLRVVDVAEHLAVAPSTAHRLLATLVLRGFAVSDPVTRSYRKGPVLAGMGRSADPVDVVTVARPYVRALAEQLHETVNLVVLEGAQCRFVEGVSGDRPLRTSVRAGTVLPAHAASGGKVLLAELDPVQLDRLLRVAAPRALTPRTLVDPAALRAQLDQVRAQGWAVNEGESEDGITAVAAPVRDATGTAVAALAVSAPSTRCPQDVVRAMAGAVVRAAGDVGRDLGARRSTDVRHSPGR